MAGKNFSAFFKNFNLFKNKKDLAPAVSGQVGGKKVQVPGSEFANPKILEIDLIKDEIPVIFDWRKNLYFLAGFVFLALIMVGEVYFVLYSWEQKEIKKRSDFIQGEVSKINVDIKQAQQNADAAINFENKLDSFTSVFNQHVYWTNFFRYLQKNTLAVVSYGDFTGDLTGNYVFPTVISDFRALSQQLKNFSNDPHTLSATITDEKVTGSTEMGAGATFNLNLKIKPAIFSE